MNWKHMYKQNEDYKIDATSKQKIEINGIPNVISVM